MRTSAAGVLALAIATAATAETIRYEAYALGPAGTRQLLNTGTRQYSASKDVEVVATSQPNRWTKRLLLFGDYQLEADVYREPSLDGFGLVINQRGNPNGFSWNWFDRDQGDVFIKRRGPGRIKVAVIAEKGLVELAAVEFLDDITLRYTDDMCCHEPGAHTHEFVVARGSVFRVTEAAP